MPDGKNPAGFLRLVGLGAFLGATAVVLLWLLFVWAALPVPTGFHGSAAWEHVFLILLTSGLAALALIAAQISLGRIFLTEARHAAQRGYL